MKVIITIVWIAVAMAAAAQTEKLTVDQAIGIALKNNFGIKASSYDVESQRQLKKTSFDLPKTNVSMLYGQYNSYAKNDNNFTITQSIPFAALGSQGALNRSLIASSQLKKAATENELTYQVKQVYYQLAFVQARRSLLSQQDSIYEGFLKAASLRYKTGEANLLEQTTAETQRNEVENQMRQNEANSKILRTQLRTLLNVELLPEIAEGELNILSLNELPDSLALAANPTLAFVRQQVQVAQNQKKIEAAKFAPELLVGYFNQTLIGVVDTETGSGTIATSNDRFSGFQVGISLPLWFAPHQGRWKAAEFKKLEAQSNYQLSRANLLGQLQQATEQYLKNKNSLDYYRTSALPNAELILKQSQIAFRAGEIDYALYLLGVRNAITIKESYLQTLNDFNQSIIYIEFLSGNK